MVVNKWDLVPNKDDMLYRNSQKYIDGRLPVVGWSKAIYTSAKTGLRASDVFKAVTDAADQHQRRVTTAVMNEVLEDGVRWQKPPSTSTGRQGSVYYCAQVAASPPTIAIFVNDPALFSDTYRRYAPHQAPSIAHAEHTQTCTLSCRRYLERHFRKSLGFDGTPIRFLYRSRRAREVKE